MILIGDLKSLPDWLSYRAGGKKIGFVPTMGYLHEGHLSLVKRAKAECDIVVVSIYVNPAQFAAGEDLSRYPRDLQRDLSLLDPYQVDYVFTPDDRMMYPSGYKSWVEVKGISDLYCGASREGHFVGVATIVLKLVNLISADYMYMGEKDFQQITVLKTMLRDLNHHTQIVSCPIVREADGLAMSSRNVYLSVDERQNALGLYKALCKAREQYQAGINDITILQGSMLEILSAYNVKVDYIAIVDSESLELESRAGEKSRILIASFVGKTRLIDNMALRA